MGDFTAWISNNLWILILPIAVLVGIVVGMKRRSGADDSGQPSAEPPRQPTAQRPVHQPKTTQAGEPAPPPAEAPWQRADLGDDTVVEVPQGAERESTPFGATVALKRPLVQEELAPEADDDATMLITEPANPSKPSRPAAPEATPPAKPTTQPQVAPAKVAPKPEPEDRTELMGQPPEIDTKATVMLSAEEIARYTQAEERKVQREAQVEQSASPASPRDDDKTLLDQPAAPATAPDKSTAPARQAPRGGERVEFAAFSKTRVKPGEIFILDVWAYLPQQYFELLDTAKTLREQHKQVEDQQRGGGSGQLVSVRLDAPGLEVQVDSECIDWAGKPAHASFFVTVPASRAEGHFPATAYVAVDGVTITKLMFQVAVGPETADDYTDRSGQLFYPRRAYACFADEDADQVMRRMHSLSRLAPDLEIFLDAPRRRADPAWKDSYKEKVSTQDAFYLFWSGAASQSNWVESEWRYALASGGADYIYPVPLDQDSISLVPRELASLDFPAALRAWQQYQEIQKG